MELWVDPAKVPDTVYCLVSLLECMKGFEHEIRKLGEALNAKHTDLPSCGDWKKNLHTMKGGLTPRTC